MKCSHLLLLAASVPSLAFAQNREPVLAAADANAPVAPLQYHSVFADYVPPMDPQQTPDKGWIRANQLLLGEQTMAPMVGSQAPALPGNGEPEINSQQQKHVHEGTHR